MRREYASGGMTITQYIASKGYTTCEYIGIHSAPASQEPHIDTGYVPNNPTDFELYLKCDITTWGENYPIWGSGTMFGGVANIFLMDETIVSPVSSISGNNNELKYQLKDGYIRFYCNEQLAQRVAPSFPSGQNSIWLGAMNGDSNRTVMGLRIRRAYLYDAGLKRDYYPCYKIGSTNPKDIGLYELVTDTFFGNANPTLFTARPFTKGPDYNFTDKYPVEY